MLFHQLNEETKVIHENICDQIKLAESKEKLARNLLELMNVQGYPLEEKLDVLAEADKYKVRTEMLKDYKNDITRTRILLHQCEKYMNDEETN